MALEKIMATAEITIIDETDASVLTGNMQVIKGSRNQVFITGLANPYSPDWSKTNLVIRPFLQASNITKLTEAEVEYNPDLFDPKEYTNGIDTYNYIKNIHWYIRDSSGSEEEIFESEQYSLTCTYPIGDKSIVCNDARQLVVKSNVLSKNSTADIICKFSFYDPFAKLTIPQTLTLSISNLASGLSNSKIVTNFPYGDSITNSGIQYLDVISKFYGDSGEESITDMINDGEANVSCLFYIMQSNGWNLLDPTLEGQTTANSTTNLYKYKTITEYNLTTGVYTLADTSGAKGSAVIRIYPDMINSSEIFKCVFTDYLGVSYETIFVLKDLTDETKAEMYSTNGTRINQTNTKGTTLKPIVTYKGILLSESSPLYTDEFIYYWYKFDYSTDEVTVTNVYNNVSNDLIENDNLEVLVPGNRLLNIAPINVNNEAKFAVDIVEKSLLTKSAAQENYYSISLLEEDLNSAIVLCSEAGIDDLETAIFTAKELNTFNE